jgi:ATP-dependent helicase/DNAse subunit B
LEDGRERLFKATNAIKSARRGREFCAAVRGILREFGVEERLKSLEEKVVDLSQKGYLSQIYRALEGLLMEAEQLTGGKELTATEFAAILQDGLAATEISLIPLKTDAVFIGNITDSRIEKVRVLFAMGMTDEVPRSTVDTAIVSDKEIKRLAEIQTKLEPTVAEVNLRARESVCLNLCTFLDKLYVSYPLGADGSEPALSEIFRYIDGTFGRIEKGKKLPVPRRKKYEDEDFVFRCRTSGRIR